MDIISKQEFIDKLIAIRNRGWIPNARPGNDGGVGNTLEDLLGIEENNLPIPNAAEWELKTQRASTSSLTTLLHMEPSPRAAKLVPNLLLPKYGWRHKDAGSKYLSTEMSFRQTLNALTRTDRGFGIGVDNVNRRIVVSFDAGAVDPRHADWLREVRSRVGVGELNPQPYWGFDDLFHSIASKLHNCFYLKVDVRRESGKEFYHYREIWMLETLALDRFVLAVEQGKILIDFDARTGHNHGTKIRLRQGCLRDLYAKSTVI